MQAAGPKPSPGKNLPGFGVQKQAESWGERECAQPAQLLGRNPTAQRDRKAVAQAEPPSLNSARSSLWAGAETLHVLGCTNASQNRELSKRETDLFFLESPQPGRGAKAYQPFTVFELRAALSWGMARAGQSLTITHVSAGEKSAESYVCSCWAQESASVSADPRQRRGALDGGSSFRSEPNNRWKRRFPRTS